MSETVHIVDDRNVITVPNLSAREMTELVKASFAQSKIPLICWHEDEWDLPVEEAGKTFQVIVACNVTHSAWESFCEWQRLQGLDGGIAPVLAWMIQREKRDDALYLSIPNDELKLPKGPRIRRVPVFTSRSAGVSQLSLEEWPLIQGWGAHCCTVSFRAIPSIS